ncbi:hypothetical protein [Breznakiella homolactica]|uniref:Uncharacterized protein n=1 Tax=Breznakiella homolactica TaxID=2798577 RepID=A0A7T8BAM6_9SPIR|nr:hypothetical protein [Breznakiella homolactica]QQO10864.1 hypothetical protein JFL75_08095 [Breznakiella homolactica]
MKTIIYCWLFLFIISFNLYSIKISVGEADISLRLTDTDFTIDNYNFDPPIKETYSVEWEAIDNMTYIKFNYTGQAMGEKIARGEKRYLVLFSK